MAKNAKAKMGEPCPAHSINECGECHGALYRERGDKIGTLVLVIAIITVALVVLGFVAKIKGWL